MTFSLQTSLRHKFWPSWPAAALPQVCRLSRKRREADSRRCQHRSVGHQGLPHGCNVRQEAQQRRPKQHACAQQGNTSFTHS